MNQDKITIEKQCSDWRSKYEVVKKDAENNQNIQQESSKTEQALKKKVMNLLEKIENEEIKHAETKDTLDHLKIQVAQKDKEIAALEYGLEDYKRNTNPVMSQLTNMFERSGRIVTAS